MIAAVDLAGMQVNEWVNRVYAARDTVMQLGYCSGKGRGRLVRWRPKQCGRAPIGWYQECSRGGVLCGVVRVVLEQD